MEYRRLGDAGLKVSRLCLGMMSYGDPEWRPWVLPGEDARPFVAAAADAGINFFDTSDMYSNGASEEATGRALREVFSRRDEYVLATKVFHPLGPGPNDRGLSRKHILASVDASLRRLGTDHIDVYHIHRWDPDTPIEETMEALHHLVSSGKVLYLAASSMRAWQFAKAQRVATANGWTPFVAMQNHYNLVDREEEREMIPQCIDMGVAINPWSPLARGLLAGSRSTDSTRAATDRYADQLYGPDDEAVYDRVAAVAGEFGVSAARVALSWVLGRPGVVSPIIGARKVEHLMDAVGALEVELTAEQIASLQADYEPRPLLPFL